MHPEEIMETQKEEDFKEEAFKDISKDLPSYKKDGEGGADFSYDPSRLEDEDRENLAVRMARHDLMTGPENTIATSPFVTNSLALFSDGTLYITKGRETHPEVVSFIEGHARIGTKILRMARIEYRDLLRIYEEKDGGSHKKKVRERTDKQREFLEIIAQASIMHASDIHMTLWPTLTTIEFRIDGVIEKTGEVSHQDGRALMIAAFNMADTSGISHQMQNYQEARISSMSASLPTGLQALRLQFNPLVFRGRILIVRLLYSETQQSMTGLQDLGWGNIHTRAFEVARQKATGVTIISGPTGSGKSTTLKVLLEVLKRESSLENMKERHILTVEDPPEYVIDEVHQMPVVEVENREERAEEFTKAINAALRSDPDTIVIGEVRDKESARLAFSAAMSGHQVWTTLHCNSAASIIPRLHDIGVEDYKIADPENIGVLVAQRLPRMLCTKCRIPFLEGLKDEELISMTYQKMDLKNMHRLFQDQGLKIGQVYLASKGCAECRGGYAGRTIMGEAIVPDIEFLSYASQGKMVEAHRYWLEEMKGTPFQAHGLEKMLSGAIDLVEYMRWCGDIESSIKMSVKMSPELVTGVKRGAKNRKDMAARKKA